MEWYNGVSQTEQDNILFQIVFQKWPDRSLNFSLLSVPLLINHAWQSIIDYCPLGWPLFIRVPYLYVNYCAFQRYCDLELTQVVYV